MMLELRHIRYFLAAAEERHFTRAAAKVGIGQPPLSQQIKDLEAEIGTPLFRRLAHGAELTAAGEAFLEGVREMPAIALRAATAAQRASRGETGLLRIGFTASSAFNAVVPGAIRAFRRAYADVDLTLEEANTTRLVAGLRDGSIDAAFLRPGAVGSEAFQLRQLSEEPLMVALPANHPAASQRKVDLATLKHDPFLLFPRSVGPTSMTALSAHAGRPVSSRSSVNSLRSSHPSSTSSQRNSAHLSYRRRVASCKLRESLTDRLRGKRRWLGSPWPVDEERRRLSCETSSPERCR